MEIINRDNETTIENGTYTDCSKCPCLNRDCDYGNECNLLYDVSYGSVKSSDFRDFSKNCGLITIFHKIHIKGDMIGKEYTTHVKQKKFTMTDAPETTQKINYLSKRK